MKNNLWLNDAMIEFDKKFTYNKLNILNSSAGSGKTTFVFNNLINESIKYVDGINYNFNYNLDKVMYVCDTSSLRDKILEEHKDITKSLTKGELVKSLNNNKTNDGKILVITYSMLGYLLKNINCKKCIEKFNLIMFDEIHNLFRYGFKYGKNSGEYETVVYNLKHMCEMNNLLMIGISATFDNYAYVLEKCNIDYKVVFNISELCKIKKYTNKHVKYINYTQNILKEYALNPYRLYDEKMLIYTNTIKQAEIYKSFLNKYQIKTEWICSSNANKMNASQIKIRNEILNNNIIPDDDLKCLIINGAYETGIDIKDNTFQHVIIDDISEVTWVQARNRLRHNIKYLYLKCKYKEDSTYEGHYIKLDKWKYGQLIESNEDIYIPNLCGNIDDKYLNTKLTKDMKDEMVEKYATKKCNMKNKPTWQSLKHDLNNEGYININKNGTYIYTPQEYIKKFKGDSMKNKNQELYNFLDELVGVKLDKEQQNNVINKIDVRVGGRQQRSYSKLNEGLKMANLNFIIIPKKSGSNRYWIIEKIEN